MHRLNWMLGAIIGIIVCVVLSHTHNQNHQYLHSFQTFLTIGIIGHIDVIVMEYLSRTCSIKSKHFIFKRCLLTYPASILCYLALWPPFAYLADFQFSYTDIELFCAFSGSGIIINTLVILLHNSILFYEYRLRSELEVAALKNANTEAVNMVLRQQIQPHFLFNALNTLKAIYHSDVQMADKYLVHMADFLRASIFSRLARTNTLEEEVTLALNYLGMQQMRFTDALVCNIHLSQQEQKGYSIPSFSLQPLIENAIKHNNFTKESPLKIDIVNRLGWLVISNNIQKKNIRVDSTNFGLSNLKERYELISGDEIMIIEDVNTFSVSIKLLENN